MIIQTEQKMLKVLFGGLVVAWIVCLFAGQCWGYELPMDEQVIQSKYAAAESTHALHIWCLAAIIGINCSLFLAVTGGVRSGRILVTTAVTGVILLLWAVLRWGAG